jgi:hypothetical protein
MRRVSPIESNGPGILTQRAINDIRMQEPPSLKALAIVSHRSEQRPLKIITVFCEIEIITILCGRLSPRTGAT